MAWIPRSDVSFNLPDPKPSRIVPMGCDIDEYDLKENISDKKLWCLVIFQSLEKNLQPRKHTLGRSVCNLDIWVPILNVIVTPWEWLEGFRFEWLSFIVPSFDDLLITCFHYWLICRKINFILGKNKREYGPAPWLRSMRVRQLSSFTNNDKQIESNKKHSPVQTLELEAKNVFVNEVKKWRQNKFLSQW